MVVVIPGQTVPLDQDNNAAMRDRALDALFELHAARQSLDEQEFPLVKRARYAGATWEDIGAYLGVSGERVRFRHAARLPERYRGLP